jgi:hypothetical protein
LHQLEQASCQSSAGSQLIVRLMLIVLLIGVSPFQRWVVTCALLLYLKAVYLGVRVEDMYLVRWICCFDLMEDKWSSWKASKSVGGK